MPFSNALVLMSSCASQKGSILKWNKNTKFRMAFDFYFDCHAFNLSVFVWDAELWKGLNVFCGLRFLLSLIQTGIADISFDKNNIRPTVSKGCLTLGSFVYYLPKVTKPFNNLSLFLLIELYIRKVLFYNLAVGISHP